MLTHLAIQDFALVDNLELDFHTGMTAVTGETGAGKSLVINALDLVLGGRTDPSRVKTGAKQSDIAAIFDISTLPTARSWLAKQDLPSDQECLLRRVITAEGRSRGYINGRSVTLNQLRQLGEHLVSLHGQHAHQQLLNSEHQCELLDNFGQLSDTKDRCRQRWLHWQSLQKNYDYLHSNQAERLERIQLLGYQLQELQALAPQKDEYAALEDAQRQLENAESLIRSANNLAHLCDNEEGGINQMLTQAQNIIDDCLDHSPALSPIAELLTSAQISIEEAGREITQFAESCEVDPEKLADVEQRLSTYFDLSRKHRIAPNQLCDLTESLTMELEHLQGSDQSIADLEKQCAAAEKAYRAAAKQLSDARTKAADQLQSSVQMQLNALSMGDAHFVVEVAKQPDKPGATGIDRVELLISTNRGQPAKALGKIVSGGELSRISLAIQVVTAKTTATPTQIFDEVDVGIGGATADIVGRLLRTLSGSGQIICVTHLPQVASKGHHHLHVAKQRSRNKTRSTLREIHGEDKIMEIARMMGGTELTRQSIAHAREMLAN